MGNNIHVRFNARDRSYFSILKKEIHNIVSRAGFSEFKTGEIDIIVAEMASNLVKHAGGGELLVCLLAEKDNEAIEVISIDNGIGMADPARMLEDGISTVNTLGHGLGAIKRLSDTFEIYSQKDWGTIVLSRVYKNGLPFFNSKPRVEVKSIIVAKPGEVVSGDGFCYKLDKEYFQLFLGDGLGHGIDAHKAVSKAIETVQHCLEVSPIAILRAVHAEVKKTRGLVGSVASYSFKDKTWSICGVGNIATRTQSGLVVKNHMSYNGIIGLNIPNTLKEQEIVNERGQVIIMTSDGIRTRFDLQKYPGIFKYDLSIMAAAIFKDHARETDDMSVIVGRINLS